MRGLLVAFLVLFGLLSTLPQIAHGAGNPVHGNVASAGTDTGGHALDSDKTVAEEESGDGGGPCTEGSGAVGMLAYYACRVQTLLRGSLQAVLLPLLALLLLLTLSTLMLWVYTRKAANAARLAAEYVPAVERAYVFGGPTDLFLLHDQASVRLAMQNYGKTPAVIREWLVEFVAQEPRGSRPGYDKAKRTVTNEILEPFKLFSPPTVFRSEIAAPFFIVGYITYDDVFRQSHTTRFCVGVARDGKAAYAGHAQWNVFD